MVSSSSCPATVLLSYKCVRNAHRKIVVVMMTTQRSACRQLHGARIFSRFAGHPTKKTSKTMRFQPRTQELLQAPQILQRCSQRLTTPGPILMLPGPTESFLARGSSAFQSPQSLRKKPAQNGAVSAEQRLLLSELYKGSFSATPGPI